MDKSFIVATLQFMAKEEAKRLLEEVAEELGLNDEPKLADQIVISHVDGADEDGGTACGAKCCPFFHFAVTQNGADICSLPGGGEGVICWNNDPWADDVVLHVKGKSVCQHRRLPKCLALKPPA